MGELDCFSEATKKKKCFLSDSSACVCEITRWRRQFVVFFLIFIFSDIAVTQHAAYFQEEHQGRWPSVPKHTTQTDVDAVDCMRNPPSCQVEFGVTNCRLWKQESLVDIAELFLELFHHRGGGQQRCFITVSSKRMYKLRHYLFSGYKHHFAILSMWNELRGKHFYWWRSKKYWYFLTRHLIACRLFQHEVWNMATHALRVQCFVISPIRYGNFFFFFFLDRWINPEKKYNGNMICLCGEPISIQARRRESKEITSACCSWLYIIRIRKL